MMQINFHDWVLECDVEATREAYSIVEKGSADSCSCNYCKNFVALRDEVFQEGIAELLETLGVDYKKDAETYEATLEKNKHCYALWFHSIGRIIKKGEPVTLKNKLIVYFLESKSLSFDVFENKNLIQIEIENAVLPWVLEASLLDD